jgi:hypothetical protein
MPATFDLPNFKEVQRMKVDRAEIVAKSGLLTVAQLSKLYDITERQVREIVERAGGKIKISHEERAKTRKQIARFIKDGGQPEQAAKNFNVTLAYVKRCCKDEGVSFPSGGRVGRQAKKVTGFRIIAAFVEHPSMGEDQVAEMFDVSRQYVNIVRTKASKEGLLLAIERAKARAIDEYRKSHKK